MPRDTRLYMTFPIDFWQHPKITILSDAAFRTFVEMNGYSRMQDLDGRIPAPTAKRMWKPKALAELMKNHPERPSLTIEGDEYVIWNYAEHQLTRADREALTEKNRANGMKGGRPRKNPPETQSVTDRNPTGTDSKAESESRSESGSEMTKDTHIRLVLETPAEASTDGGKPVDNSAHWASFGITDIGQVQRAIVTAIGHPISEQETGRIVGWIMAKAETSGTKPRSMQAYVLGSVRKSWAEVQQYWHEEIAS
jgi:hypothetical protein